LTETAARYPGFKLKMQSEVTDLIEQNGQIVGVKGQTPNGPFEARAHLVVGADGRQSIVRKKAGLQIHDLGAPIDVLWIRLSKRPTDADLTLGYFRAGSALVTINRGDYWQCARIIFKGSFEEIRQRGLPAFREDLSKIAPFFSDRVGELESWDAIKLLSVSVDRLRTWYRPGLLCIGDSAHAMSPVGGVGINLAIQDAVAAANILANPLLRAEVTQRHLMAVERRRQLPTRLTQAFQVQAHNRVIYPLLAGKTNFEKLPLVPRLFRKFPILRRIPARLIGIGVRPEHVKTPSVQRTP
jgi:2-polyprenyl-6-methoxyphenol hydroxylase-like FAD-dependent oxidoreductase